MQPRPNKPTLYTTLAKAELKKLKQERLELEAERAALHTGMQDYQSPVFQAEHTARVAAQKQLRYTETALVFVTFLFSALATYLGVSGKL
jgi:hypothetical protein